MQTFSIRDLREHTGDLVRNAEAGHLAVVAKHGQPVFVAVPFDEALLTHGVRPALAAKLFQEGVVSLGKAARMAGLPVEDFIERLGALGIPATDYPPEELDDELNVLAA